MPPETVPSSSVTSRPMPGNTQEAIKTQPPGLKRLYQACGYSWRGFKAAWKNEAAIRQECLTLCGLVPLTLILDVSHIERALLVASLFFVLVVELLNSAIEATVDRISTSHHPLSGQAKDMGSAAVMGALIMAAGVWLCILL
ncbi:diacylglycerol kinase [Terasakiispira papahanaumokuakeensis]|uniref:diacylglycerol kinase n=1 Tax=Terasakiispira papahanaumokuakeensis TaxID=197479 RepID=UPI000AA3D23C|nr:diacylglycerol kinase [Terasakiispira papahanaumokuakeensis]